MVGAFANINPLIRPQMYSFWQKPDFLTVLTFFNWTLLW